MSAPLPELGLPELRESHDAGRYYCAHSLFVAHQVAREPESFFATDAQGRPLAGFVHVPVDAQATGGGAAPEEQRHHGTCRVVGAALAGWLPVLGAAAPEGDLRVLVTGFGAFREVLDNPTGAFVGRAEHAARALEIGLGARLLEVGEVGHGIRAEVSVGAGVRTVDVHLRALPVDDRCLARAGEGSLRAALLEARAQAWLGLGVCRSACFRVEVAPSDVGLVREEGGWRHEPDAPARTLLPRNRSLLEAIYAGGASLAAASSRKSRRTNPGPP